ncbi:MAG TPA: PPC domain-containing protein, partial [Gemmataceae bacterium]|nr:PPC domain-containing protein [Gemmataceae bacterium]
MIRHSLAVVALLAATAAHADPPTASYIFPAGGQRGQVVSVRVGGLNLHDACGFEMLGPGVTATNPLKRTRTAWFEGPLLPLPESQQQEDYPKDMAGRVTIAADAPLGVRPWRLWTAQGATPSMKFAVGDLPEVVEQEIDGDPVPVEVTPPVTVNGRIFPREDVDVWTFRAAKGQTFTCEVSALRLGSPLDARLEVLGPDGRRIAEAVGERTDPRLRFTAPADGVYSARIHDVGFKGGQSYVYRLTITAGPYVDRTYPLGGRRGTTTKFELSGQGLPAEPVAIPLPPDGAGDYAHRLTTAGRLTNPFLLALDDLPEYLAGQTKFPVTLPAVLNGRITRPGEFHDWPLVLKKGEAVDFEVGATRLGSPLRSVLTLLDASGKELMRADSAAEQLPDVGLRFKPAADGIYRVRIRDRFGHRAGPDFAYRLRVVPADAGGDLRLTLFADVLSVNRGGQTKLKVLVDRSGGFNEPVSLTVDGLPVGVTAPAKTVLTGTLGEITIKAEATAKVAASRLTVRGTAKVGDKIITRTAVLRGARGEPDIDSVLFAVTLPTPFKVVGDYDMRWAARGTVHKRKYRIQRDGYDGPIEVRLADHQARHLQGVTGPTITVPAGATEFEYPVTLPPWMEMGRTSRTCVMAVARLKDPDGEHVVSFTSVNQNEQVVAVVGPDPLGVEVGRTSITAEPGRAVNIEVTVSRGKDFDGPVKLELVAPA